MTQATIVRCPHTPAILDYVEEVMAALLGQDVRVEVLDGQDGEFAVLVDGQLIFTRKSQDFPSTDQVSAAVVEAGLMDLAV